MRKQGPNEEMEKWEKRKEGLNRREKGRMTKRRNE